MIIETKKIGSTETKPTRMKAISPKGSMIMSYDHELNSYENHEKVAKELARKLTKELAKELWVVDVETTADGHIFCIIGKLAR